MRARNAPAPSASHLWVTACLSLAAAHCGPPESPKGPADQAPNAPPPPTAAVVASADPSARNEEAIAAMLTRVSTMRGLPVLGKVHGNTIDRPSVERMIRAKTAEELPPEVLEHETEALVALGLVSPAYDAKDGMFELVGASVTGFYEPANKTMYLTVDISQAEQEETLAHELVHALQDQHYDLGPLFKYRPDDDERVAAGHALAEGDATSAALDLVRGDSMGIPESLYGVMARTSIAALAPDVPAVLRESLVAPYIDGYAFVQGLRRRGGFAAVDAAWRSLPVTTEQILHLEKYDTKEPAIAVGAPPLDALDQGKSTHRFEQVYTQVIGEQSLRIILEAWASHDEAVGAAAGWGGDRYVLARGKDEAQGESALAWHITFDTEKDAREMADILEAQAHGSCVARPDVGPFAWAHKKRDIALVMGPYKHEGKKAQSKGTCKEARAWAASVLAP